MVDRWMTLFCYTYLNIIIGMHYFSVFPDIFKIATDSSEFTKNLLNALYPILYIISGPISYRFIWMSFYWSNWVAWFLLIMSLWLKYFDMYDWTEISGHAIIVMVSGLIIPGSGVLSVKYFPAHQQLLALILSSLGHPLGICLAMSLKSFITDKNVILAEAFSTSVIGVLFLMFTERDKHTRDGYKSFFESWKIIFENQQRGVLYISTSAQIGIIYFILADFQIIEKRAGYSDTELDVMQAIFGIFGYLGSLFMLFTFKKSKHFAMILRVALVISTLSIFMWAFLFKTRSVNTILSICTSVTLLASLPLTLLALYNTHPTIHHPFSMNLAYFTYPIFLILLIGACHAFEAYVELTGLWLCALAELLIVTSFIAVYEPDNYRKVNN